MAASDTRQTADRSVWWVFAFLTVFLYFFGLTIPLVGPDEPRYAQVAREMFERRDWVTPTLGGFNWFEKPALLYWLQIASYHVFGVSEFAARFGSALFGLGTIFSLWLLGGFAGTEFTEINAKTKNSIDSSVNSVSSVANDFATWLALIAASTLGIIVFSRGASFDIILTFPMTAALVSFFIFDLTQRRNIAETQSGIQNVSVSPRLRVSASLFGFYFFIGIAVLAKGLIGIVFPFAIVAFYHLLTWRIPGRMLALSFFWGTLVSSAVAASWYVPMYVAHGFQFIDEFFIQHHFQRFTSNKYFHPQPIYFFFWVLPLMLIPWLPFFFLAIWDFGKKAIQRGDAETRREDQLFDNRLDNKNLHSVFDSALSIFAFAWLLVPVVFSFSGSKLPGYIMPSVPPAIVLTALYVSRFVGRKPRRGRLIQATAFATLAVIIVLVLFAVPRFAETDSVKSLVSAADRRGFSAERILTLHTVSHNAEFYAAGRLLRTYDGKQKKLLGPAEVADFIRREGGSPVLVLVPLEYLTQLTSSELLTAEILHDNGELAIVRVSVK